MMPPAQGMAGGGVVRMQAGTQTPYTGGTKAYQNLIDQALMAGGTSRDIQALIGGNPEAQAVYNSMRGPNPQTASILMAKSLMGGKRLLAVRRVILPIILAIVMRIEEKHYWKI
jgi:hypothetical protein